MLDTGVTTPGRMCTVLLSHAAPNMADLLINDYQENWDFIITLAAHALEMDDTDQYINCVHTALVEDDTVM
jgi:hypothetical protein